MVRWPLNPYLLLYAGLVSRVAVLLLLRSRITIQPLPDDGNTLTTAGRGEVGEGVIELGIGWGKGEGVYQRGQWFGCGSWLACARILRLHCHQ